MTPSPAEPCKPPDQAWRRSQPPSPLWDCAPSSVAIPFLPYFTLSIVFPQYSTSSPNSPLQVNSENIGFHTGASSDSPAFDFSPLEFKKRRVAPEAPKASRSPWCNGGGCWKRCLCTGTALVSQGPKLGNRLEGWHLLKEHQGKG